MAVRLKVLHDLLAPVAETNGVELYDIEWLREGGERILRLYIDKPDGVDLNDCERVSRAAELILDEHDPIAESYMLEVSSPGIERKLKKDSHFTRYIGHKIMLRLFSTISPVDGRKKFTGRLDDYKDGCIFLTDENGETWEIDKTLVSLCRLAVF
jgi:ribosome maturation factor RimP